MIIVGSDPLVDRIATYVSLTKGVEVVGRVVDAPTPDDGSLGTVSDLPQLCEKYPANRIIVAFPTSMSHDSVTVLRSLPASGPHHHRPPLLRAGLMAVTHDRPLRSPSH